MESIGFRPALKFGKLKQFIDSLTFRFSARSFAVPKYVRIFNEGHHFFISISQLRMTEVGTTMRCGPQIARVHAK